MSRGRHCCYLAVLFGAVEGWSPQLARRRRPKGGRSVRRMAEARSAEAPADQLKPLLDEATLIGSGSYGLVYKGSMKGRRCVAKHATPGNKKASSYLEREAAVNS